MIYSWSSEQTDSRQNNKTVKTCPNRRGFLLNVEMPHDKYSPLQIKASIQNRKKEVLETKRASCIKNAKRREKDERAFRCRQGEDFILLGVFF